MKVIINGKFLTRKTTGVQRFAREVVFWIDRHPEVWKGISFVLVAPSKSFDSSFVLKNIPIYFYKKRGGFWWEQISLFFAFKRYRGDILLSLCNLAPVLLKKKNIVCIHDVSFLVNPGFYKKVVVLIYRFLFYREAVSASVILTVTNFSKSEIVKRFHVNAERIVVVGSGGNPFSFRDCNLHFAEMKAPLPENFYFMVGSISPNKNLKYIIECARANPSQYFVVSGEKNRIFGHSEIGALPNLLVAGYLTDAEIYCLYQRCKGLILPSFYEGFGLPPIEAVFAGCRKIIVSDIPVFHEIFKDSAFYIDPHDYANFPFLSTTFVMTEEEATRIKKTYCWENVASKVMLVISSANQP